MADIANFIQLGMISNVVNLSRRIKLAHLRERKLPVLLILLPVESFVAQAVLDASLVSKPNIIACSKQFECWSNIREVHDPAISGISNTMLQEDCWPRRVIFILLGFNSEHVQNIAIISDDFMTFKEEPILNHNLFKSLFEIRIWFG